jgi:hypothetical protein
MRTLAALLLAILTFTAHADGPWLKANDVVALVGGEDMVALAEEGWLETLVTQMQPKDHIRFRSLAWEGDTVFEQRRDLNYPTLEQQLDKIGATFVICGFGKMESFAGKEGVAAFTEAYDRLIQRLLRKGVKRFGLVDPAHFSPPPKGANLPDLTARNADLDLYREAILKLTIKHNLGFLISDEWPDAPSKPYATRDGIHLLPGEQFLLAQRLGLGLQLGIREHGEILLADATATHLPLHDAINAKNRLWFHYTRPQNWAFLAGNRTNQPSSRDHLDPTKRWFPAEMEQWVPLIEAKEKEIQALAEAPR